MLGGNFVTEASPTNFHTFAPKRILLDGQSADDYKEVTPAERSAIEAEDATWVQPSDDVIKRAKANGIEYNTKTGFFVFNTLTDLSEEDVINILEAGRPHPGNSDCLYYGKPVRTNLPLKGFNKYANVPYASTISIFKLCDHLEVANVDNLRFDYDMFFGCGRLRKIIGSNTMIHSTANVADLFGRCVNLEEIESFPLSNLKSKSINLSPCPNLNLGTFQRMIATATQAEAISITVHPDVYAKITDEANAEWHQLLTDAAAKNITFLSS